MADQEPLVVEMSPPESTERQSSLPNFFEIIREFKIAYYQKKTSELKRLHSNYKSFFDEIQCSDVFENLTKDSFDQKIRNNVMDSILKYACNHAQNIELLFFAAAKFDARRLESVLEELKKSLTYLEDIKKTKFFDTVVIFALKYGNIDNESFLPCMTMLFEAGVDFNKFDYIGKTAIDYVADLYKTNENSNEVLENLEKVAKLILQKPIFKPERKSTLKFLAKMQIDAENHNFSSMDDRTRLFFWITNNKTREFLEFEDIKTLADSDNGEYTLLQLACSKTEKMLDIVKFLLKNGADPNLTTQAYKLTPLEIAGFKNYTKIFEELLRNQRTMIKEEHFFNFVKWRSQPMKAKLFELLLESEKLDPKFVYETGNTPLHYAILFSHKNAIQVLLKRQPCLLDGNKNVLGIIDSEDLEKYFDYCLAFDNYNNYFSDPNYKMLFRFDCLIDNAHDLPPRETRVVNRIAQRPNLEHLLKHPLVHTFITLKWFKVKTFFWIVLLLQAAIFLTLSVLFYFLSYGPTVYICFVVTVINVVLKGAIFLTLKIKNKRREFFMLKRALLHGSLEIILMVTTIGSFFQNQFRAFVFVEMGILLLLTAGYHPKLSKWSVMLQQVFTTFSLLFLFFSVIIIAFSIGFQLLFPHNEFFENIFTSIFKTYIMTTGEFDLEMTSLFQTAGFGGYSLFFFFAIGVSLVVANFCIGVAVTDIERIEQNSEVIASKNVIVFMLFADFIYYSVVTKIPRIRKLLDPLLFSEKKENDNFKVDFFVNKENQFDRKDFPTRIDNESFNKIKKHYEKFKKVTSEQELLNNLQDIKRMLQDLKANNSKKSQNDKNHERKRKEEGKKKGEISE